VTPIRLPASRGVIGVARPFAEVKGQLAGSPGPASGKAARLRGAGIGLGLDPLGRFSLTERRRRLSKFERGRERQAS
jgi:hypothetical protein